MNATLEKTVLELLERQLDARGLHDPADREIARSIVRAAIARVLDAERAEHSEQKH